MITTATRLPMHGSPSKLRTPALMLKNLPPPPLARLAVEGEDAGPHAEELAPAPATALRCGRDGGLGFHLLFPVDDVGAGLFACRFAGHYHFHFFGCW